MSARDLAGVLLVLLGIVLVVAVKAELDLRGVRADLAAASARLERLEANDDDQDERLLSFEEDLVRAGLVPSLEEALQKKTSATELDALPIAKLLELEVEPASRATLIRVPSR